MRWNQWTHVFGSLAIKTKGFGFKPLNQLIGSAYRIQWSYTAHIESYIANDWINHQNKTSVEQWTYYIVAYNAHWNLSLRYSTRNVASCPPLSQAS